jgi:hypothetical protein
MAVVSNGEVEVPAERYSETQCLSIVWRNGEGTVQPEVFVFEDSSTGRV